MGMPVAEDAGAATEDATGDTPAEQCLSAARRHVGALLATAGGIKCFVGRWQALRGRLEQLGTCLDAVAESPHWSENELLRELLPAVRGTLGDVGALARQCANCTYSGKLLMQSDLDRASARAALHVRELDVLIKSGVLRQSSAIVLSFPSPGAPRDEVAFFVRDLFARLQIGGPDFKLKALENLVQLLQSSSDDSAAVVSASADCDLACIVGLLDSFTPAVAELACVAVAALSGAADHCRQQLVNEGALGPLVRLLESGTAGKEHAAVAIERLTANSDNAWALAAYGGVPALIHACRGGSSATQSAAASALKNVAGVEEIRRAMADDGAVPTLVSLAAAGHEAALDCLHALCASGDDHRRMAGLIVDSGGLQSLVNLLCSTTPTTRLQELAIRALHGLSGSSVAGAVLAASPVFLGQLSRLLRGSSTAAQSSAASVVCNLCVCNETRKAVGDAGCIPALIKMLESKSGAAQEVAAQALASLLLVQSNRREFMRDDKGVARLVQLLDPRSDAVSKKVPVSALLALSVSKSCRKKIAVAGAPQHLQKLSEMDVPGARKVLQRVSGNRLRNMFIRKWKTQVIESRQMGDSDVGDFVHFWLCILSEKNLDALCHGAILSVHSHQSECSVMPQEK